MEKLEDYLEKRELEFKKIQQELVFLRAINIPLEVNYSEGKNGLEHFRLFSTDYSLAENLKIEMRHEWGQSGSGYDGCYSEETRKWYPQFYFYIKAGNKKKIVEIQHIGFEKDDKMIVRGKESSRGSGRGYGSSEYNWEKDMHIDPTKTYEYFRKLGVKEPLMKKLDRELKRRDQQSW